LDLQVLVVLQLFCEQLVAVKLEPLLVQVVQQMQVQPVQLLVVAPLELVEHLCLVQQMLLAHLAYWF
jgi:hypothetical protein